MAIDDILNDIVSGIKDALSDEQIKLVSDSIKDALSNMRLTRGQAMRNEERKKIPSCLIPSYPLRR